ncbi:hypothetical protein DACRYDRAFT_94909 [Dacryopinax primogenitus]|uniref:Uncharacterized protein n=1 Tax=Dacryopinax primogenitus (strain DJM 731) TaxID=1858805 RepID=M5FZL3_DACPD|nr:uncharacterized protein DACRYDRAFT_94909 [Dacryopinax primogenitus]EJU01954.1 hypothetical protein DACRYDRAFT_94909 [Dacryopinax primogenitus]
MLDTTEEERDRIRAGVKLVNRAAFKAKMKDGASKAWVGTKKAFVACGPDVVKAIGKAVLDTLAKIFGGNSAEDLPGVIEDALVAQIRPVLDNMGVVPAGGA